MVPLSSLEPKDVSDWVAGRGLPAYRAGQILRWFYQSSADSFQAMSNLPPAVRGALAEDFTFSTLEPRHQLSADQGLTRKILYGVGAGDTVETVLMHYPRTARSAERTTVCLSTQVGCAVGCPFCATGLAGLSANMSGAQVIDQVLGLCRVARAEGGRVSHLVYMGMGEPLHNLDATLTSARRFCDPAALGLGVRRVTVSTSGVVPGIDALAMAGGGVNLAISLHAPDDELRDQLVPLNRRWPIGDLLAAAGRYSGKTGRRVSYEYVMLGGVNDSDSQARALVALLKGRLAHVNLIPFNAIPGDPYRSSPGRRIAAFRDGLTFGGIQCTVRDTRGRRIDAACGQLRATHGVAARTEAAAAQPVT